MPEIKLNHLNAVLNSIEKPINTAHPRVLRPFEKILNALSLYIKRSYYFIITRQWNNNKSAAQVVRYYLYKATVDEQNPTRNKKLQDILQKLQKLNRAQKYKLEGIDKAWLNSTPSNKGSFKRVKGMPKIDSKTLFHIHANSFGANNKSLEGSTIQEMLGYVNTFLQKRKEQNLSCYGLSEELLGEIKDAHLLAEDFNTHAAEKINEAFIQQKRLLLPGGWIGAPGHALYYELIPTGDKGTVRVFGLGAGSSTNQFGATVGNKEKYLPYVDFVGVSKSKLLDPNVIQALNELHTCPLIQTSGIKTEYAEKDIYEGLKDLLSPEEVSKNEDVVTIEMPKGLQGAGVCSYRSFLAFLSTRMPKDDYKAFVCDINLQSLLDRVDQIGSDTLSKSDWHLLKKSQQRLNRKISKAYERSIVGNRYAFKAYSKLQRISNWLDQKRDETFSSPSQDPSQISRTWTGRIPSIEVKNIPPLHTLVNAANSINSSPPCSYIYDQVKALNPALDTAIPALVQIAEHAKSTNEHQALQTSLISYFTNLDVQNSAAAVNEDDKKKMVADLGKLSALFFETCLLSSESDTVHPERHCVLLKILHLQNELSPQKFKFDLGDLQSSNFFFRFRDKKLAKEFKDLHSYFLDFDHEKYQFSGGGEFKESSVLTFSKNGGSFNQNMRNLFPESFAKVGDNIPNFDLLPNHTQNAYVYASEEVPDWFKGLRNTHLYLLYLSHESILNPFKSPVDCSLEFSVSPEKEECKISFSVKGVTADLLEFYPTAKKNRVKKKYRYENLFRPIQNPRIKKIVHKLVNKSFANEKNLLSEVTDDELYKTLQHIQVDKDLQIAETFSYFVKNPAKLSDLDFQVLFEIFFFKEDLLKKEMLIPGFADNLGNFLVRQYQSSLKENNIQTSVFLLKMLRLCGEHCPNNPLYAGTMDHLRSMLLIAGLAAEEKSVIYAEIISALSKKTVLDDDDLFNLLSGVSFLEKNPVPLKWRCPETQKNIFHALHIHSTQIKTGLLHLNAPNQLLLQKLSKEIHGHELTNWSHEVNAGEFPSFKTDGPPKVTYLPLKGRFIIENATTRLPLEIVENIQFKQLYKNITEATQLSNGVFELNEPPGYRTLLLLKGNQLTIEQFRGGQWYRFVPRQNFLDDEYSYLGSMSLAINYNHWMPLGKPSEIDIVDPKTNQSCYRTFLNADGFINTIVRLSDSAVLGNPSSIVQDFEHPLYIQEWYKNEKLIEVELPRYDLKFTHEKGKLLCKGDKHQGFFISKQQYLSAFGSHTHFLLLENDKGAKKVLIPEHYFKPLGDEKESLAPLTVINQNASAEFPKQSYDTFDVSSDGSLKSHSRKSNLFLAYIFLSAGEYDSAAKHLKKYGQKLSLYTEEEKALLVRIANMDKMNGDEHANALSIRLYTYYLLLKNSIDHNQQIPKCLQISPLNPYLEKYHHVSELKLNKHEEAFLLKFALSKSFNAKQFIRLTELDPAYAATYIPPVEEKKMESLSPQNSGLKELLTLPQFDGKFLPFSTKTAMITRINPFIHFDFYGVYNVALNGSPDEKKWLKDALTFSKDAEGAPYRLLMECILENPAQFPACDPNIKSSFNDSYNLWRKIIKIADGIGSDKLKKLSKPEKVVKLPDWTPANFLLDPVETKIEGFQVSSKKIQTGKPFKDLCKSCFRIVEKSQAEDRADLQKMLENEAANPAFNEPLYKDKFKELNKDASIKSAPSKRYELNAAKTKKIEKILKSGKQQAEKKIAMLEQEILEIGNRRSSQGNQNILERFAQESGGQKVLTINELLVHYARQSTADLIRRNPNLDQAAVEILFGRIGEFLALQTHEQQRQRASNQLAEIKKCKDGSEKSEMVQQLAATLFDTHQYELHQHPAYLVFEYYANILLRPPQIITLAKFLENGDLNPVMEMIMGSGKSKVLLPLLGLLRADGKTLSMIVVPTPLFEDVSSNTQQILSEAFSLSLKSLHFDRNTVFTADSLQVILGDLTRISDNKECLIMTSKSIECLMLKFIEQCNVHLPKGEFPPELQLMSKIVFKLAGIGYPIVDEADTVMNVLHEVCFSLGIKLPLVMHEAQTVAILYELLYTDPQIKALARLDSDMHPDLTAPAFTEELYHQNIKLPLAKKFLTRVASETFESPSITQNVQNFVNALNDDTNNLIIWYLTHDPAHIKEAQAFFNQQNDDVKNILSLAAEQISNFLPHTLAKSCNKKYGMDPDPLNPIAIPYAAANTPNIGSQFANSYVTMNYTFQYYAKAGVDRKIIWQEIENLQSQAMNELKENNTLALDQTKAWQTFCKLRGKLPVPLFNIKEAQLDDLVREINSTEKTKREFVLNIILPHLDIFSHKISCNSHNLVELFRLIAGFTGTLWNSKSMHRKLHPFPEQGIEIKTIELLRKNSLNEIYVIKESSTKEMLRQLRDQKVTYDLVTDAGGYFKEGGNAIIAKEIAKENGVPVIFYNRKNEQTETDGENEIPLSTSKTPLDKRQTFLDQSHTTGADVPQKIGAVAIVTIDGNMLFRDLLQSVWRLRGLENKAQRVKFVLTEEVESIIKQKLKITHKPTFDDILRFTIINQVMQQGKDNFKGLQQELACTIQSTLLKVLMDDTFTPAEKQKAYLYLKDMWIKEGSRPP